MSTYNLCCEQKYVKYQKVLFENFHFLVIIFLVYLNRRVFVMFIFLATYTFESLLMCRFFYPTRHGDTLYSIIL